jgi:S1-C subfamily serine protease
LGIRNFYRERFCMHALTIQGVEAVTVAQDSPAARAGFRPARNLSPREVATATVAGLLTLSPVAPLASSFVRAAGGVNHGDIILAVNGKRVKIQEEFQREMVSYAPHTTVYFTIRRGEEVVQIPARLDTWPASTTVAGLQ